MTHGTSSVTLSIGIMRRKVATTFPPSHPTPDVTNSYFWRTQFSFILYVFTSSTSTARDGPTLEPSAPQVSTAPVDEILSS